MATLDNRLLPLIETLASSGADWLAFELIDGIQAGLVVEESADDLERARTFVRKGSSGATPLSGHPDGISQGVYPIAGDEQIDWAIEYIKKRLEDTSAMLVGALDNLNKIVEQSPRVDALSELEEAASEVTLVLQDDEASLKVNRSDAIGASNAIQSLSLALGNWRAVINNGQT